MHGGGGSMMAGGHALQGVCMRVASGHALQGVCVERGGMRGRGHA